MKKFLMVLFFCVTIINIIVAQSTDWTLDKNENVTESIAYNNVTIPANITLTIKPNGVLTVHNVLTVNGTLINESGGTIIIKDGGQVIGGRSSVTIKMEKQLSKNNNGEKWYAIASPVQIPINSAFSTFDSGTFDLYYYKEQEHEWKSISSHSSDDIFTVYQMARGFLCAVDDDKTIVMEGAIKDGNGRCNVYSTDGGASLRGYNLVGNPYPHKIYKGWNGNTSCAIANNYLASGYYRLENKEWIACNYSNAINPYESILIKTIKTLQGSSNGLLIKDLTLEATADVDKSWDRSNNEEIIISILGGSGEDRAYAYFYEGVGLDKIDHISETAPSLSIRYEEVDYAIAHVGEDSRSLDVIFKNNQSGFFTLSVDTEKANFNYLHLIDNVTGDEVDMLQENSYKFYAFGNEPENRFKLVMNPNATTTDDNVFAYVSNGDIVITGLESAATLQVFDVMGRMVSTEVISKAEGVACRTSKPSVTGVYVLRLISENGIKTQKIVVE